jgi:hypothetical protein
MRSPAEIELSRIKSVAAEYKKKGYEVLVGPEDDKLPSFLKSMRPDLVALGPDENVVVEVKSWGSLSKSKELERIADAINKQAGWRLELVVTNPRGPLLLSDEAELPDLGVQAERIELARELVAGGSLEAALLVAWAALEGVLRTYSDLEGIRMDRKSTSYVIRKLYSEGLLDRDIKETLNNGVRIRNAIVHGMREKSLKHASVQRIISVADSLRRSVSILLEVQN